MHSYGKGSLVCMSICFEPNTGTCAGRGTKRLIKEFTQKVMGENIDHFDDSRHFYNYSATDCQRATADTMYVQRRAVPRKKYENAPRNLPIDSNTQS